MLGFKITPGKYILINFSSSNKHLRVDLVILSHSSMECLPLINTSGSTIGTKLFSWHKDAYLARALQLELMHESLGILSPIVITALHLQNFAPNDSYLTNLSLNPSRP